MSDAQIRAKVEWEAVEIILSETHRRLLCSLYIEFNPQMVALLDVCLKVPRLIQFWKERVAGLVTLHLAHFPLSKNRLNSKRLAFEEARRASQNETIHADFVALVASIRGASSAGSTGHIFQLVSCDQDLRSLCTNVDDMIHDVWRKNIQDATIPPLCIPEDAKLVDARLYRRLYYTLVVMWDQSA